MPGSGSSAVVLPVSRSITGIPEFFDISEVNGGTPYGASTIAGGDGSRQPSEKELAIARFQGKHVAELAIKLHG